VSVAALEAVERVVAGGGEPDDVLRSVVDALVARGACAFAWIRFREGEELVSGPQAGAPDPSSRTTTPVLFNDDHVADLVTDGCAEPGLLATVAGAIAPHCLVGWDTGGVPWDALS
jgi:hypothetical protein